jgi:hypothetical protein
MKWIEIFRGGPQTDSNGRKHNGDAVISRALSTFNAAEHTPPLVIGHPANNAPSFGWIGGLRRTVKNGVAYLEAGVKQVYPEVARMVKDGLFKKVSASFYEDGRLRHVGLLGAAPPAVKGLADVAFSEKSNFFDFEAPVKSARATADFGMDLGGAEAALSRVDAILEALKNVRDWVTERFDAETAEKLVPARLTAPEQEQLGDGESFTEADLERAREEGRAAASAAAEKAKRRAEIAARIGGLVSGGKLPPAFVEAGIKDFCEYLGDAGGVIEFAEGSGREAAPPVDFFLDFIERFSPYRPMFSDFATKDRASGKPLDPAIETGKDIARRANR